MELELPEGAEFQEYRRIDDGHGIHVSYAAPEQCTCERCGHRGATAAAAKNTFYTCRDLDVWRTPCFLVYQPLMHRCLRCGHRQHLTPPFKRKEVGYTLRFEREVLKRLRGSTVEQVAEDLSVDAETVERIAENQIADARAKQVDPQRVIPDVGIDEFRLRKGHKLYATLLWDLSDPQRPHLLAAAQGKDEAAVQACVGRLTEAQRAAVAILCCDMGSAMLTAKKWLPNATVVIDRFHVSQKLGDVADSLRKHNHSPLPEGTEQRAAQGVSFADVAVSPPLEGSGR